MSSTISTSRPSITASRSLRIRTTPEDSVADAVGGDRHEVDLAGDVERAHQVGEEEHSAFQHPDQEQVLARVVPGDLGRQLAHAPRQIIGGDENVPDRIVVVRHVSSSVFNGALRAPVVWWSRG